MFGKTCPYCDGTFKSASGLSIHLARSTTCNERNNRMHRSLEEPFVSVGNAFSKLRPTARPENEVVEDTSSRPPEIELTEEEGFNTPDNLSDGYETPDYEEFHNFASLGDGHDSSRTRPNTQQDSEFNVTLEAIHMIMSFNNGNGLSRNDQTKLLNLLHDPRFILSQLQVYNANDIDKFMSSFEAVTFGEDVRASISYLKFIYVCIIC